MFQKNEEEVRRGAEVMWIVYQGAIEDVFQYHDMKLAGLPLLHQGLSGVLTRCPATRVVWGVAGQAHVWA